jgi:alkanesulfonate monooxygenase SsuD/methylene tetrahydromethanopterin reductase-like flavin-dependent oxidoreductase (luciferase family)
LGSLSPRARRAWTATVIPADQFGLAPWTNTFDPLVALSFIAANTTRIGLGVSVLIVPYRNPIAAAKMLPTIDRMSGGRLIAGVGAGWERG